ncbi:MAG TPA: SRPBCC domain-containing protein [Flavobacteriales bacterium]|nr:SRPBCC domain-containing protein [Flavobacteriales bacterium]HIO73089.1 SRPBCC domain-containing protein [Flavobacteriales bacterium]
MSERIKYELEYIIKSSPRVLYTRLSTADGLAQWFADDVNIQNKVFTFVWEGTGQDAKILREKAGKHIRFKWLEDTEDVYFEFRLVVDDLTSEVALIVTDFATEDEMEEAKLLWNSQVNALMHILGS